MFRILIILSLLFFSVARSQEVQEVVSEGGIKAWLIQNDVAPTISISFYFASAGAVNDPEGKRGAMNLLASMMTKGGGDLNSTAFEKRLNDLSVSMNFATGRDNFSGSMRSLKKYWNEASELLRLSLTEASLKQQDFKRTKKILLSNLQQGEKRAGTRAGNLLWQYVFADDVYALPPEGTVESFKKITLKDVKTQYKRLSKEDLYISVAGAISAEELKNSLDKIFGKLPDKKQATNFTEEATLHNQGKIILAKQDIPQTQIAFMHAGIARDDEDFFTAYLLNHIIGGSVFSSRLGKEVRESRGLAYSISSDLHSLDRAPMILGWGATNNEKASQTIELIKTIWQEASEGQFTQTELDKARQYLLGSFVVALTNTRSLANWLAYLQRENYGTDYIEYRKKRFNEVDLADVKRVAKRLFSPTSLTFAVVGMPENLNPDEIE